MAGLTKTQAIAQLRSELMDPGSTIWSDTQLGAYIDRAAKEISRKVPLQKRVGLPFNSGTRDVDLTALSDIIMILAVETPAGEEPPSFRNWSVLADRLTVALTGAPTVSEANLTGTLTFTSASAAVTGAGTQFATEVAVGDFIRRSTDSPWYRVLSIESAVALTLDEVYGGTTGADAGVTKLRTSGSVVRVYYGMVHTVGESSSTMPARCDAALLEGAQAYACTGMSVFTSNKVNIGADAMAEYFAQGRQKMALYMEKLDSLEEIYVGQTYPLD